MVDAGTAATLAFHKTGQAGFDALPNVGIGHQFFLGFN